LWINSVHKELVYLRNTQYIIISLLNIQICTIEHHRETLMFPGQEIWIKRSFSTESTGQGRCRHVLPHARGARGTNLVEPIYNIYKYYIIHSIIISRYCVVARVSHVNDVHASYLYYIIHDVESVRDGRKKWKEGGVKILIYLIVIIKKMIRF